MGVIVISNAVSVGSGAIKNCVLRMATINSVKLAIGALVSHLNAIVIKLGVY